MCHARNTLYTYMICSNVDCVCFNGNEWNEFSHLSTYLKTYYVFINLYCFVQLGTTSLDSCWHCFFFINNKYWYFSSFFFLLKNQVDVREGNHEYWRDAHIYFWTVRLWPQHLGQSHTSRFKIIHTHFLHDYDMIIGILFNLPVMTLLLFISYQCVYV